MPFNNRGSCHSERVERTLWAFLASPSRPVPWTFPADLSIHQARALSEEGWLEGPNGSAGILITFNREVMGRISEGREVADDAACLIVARWAYYWCGNENDYVTLEACDRLVDWLDELPDGVVILGEARVDVD